MTTSPRVSPTKAAAATVLDCAPLFSGEVLDEAAAARLASLLRVLADPARLRILSLLQAQPAQEACVCHVTDHLDLGQPTVSHHLRVLFDAGLVDRERRGSWVYYRVVSGALDTLREALGGVAPVTHASSGTGACDSDCGCN